MVLTLLIVCVYLFTGSSGESPEPPLFTHPLYTATLRQDDIVSLRFNHSRREIRVRPQIHAFDQDSSRNASVIYRVTKGNEEQIFDVDPLSATVHLVKPIDFQMMEGRSFHLQLEAFFANNSEDFSTSLLQIEVTGQNDTVPQFKSTYHNISIVENLPNGFSVLRVLSTERDQTGDRTSYRMEDSSKAFRFDTSSGWIIVANQTRLDREKTPHFRLVVSAVENLQESADTSHTVVDIYLIDSNDNNPTFVPTNSYLFTANARAAAGSVIGMVHAVDLDENDNGRIVYSIQPTHVTTQETSFEHFEINATRGEILLAGAPLEAAHSYTFFIQAQDQAVNPSERRTTLAFVQVLVENDEQTDPQFVDSPYEFSVSASAPVGTKVGRVEVRGFQQENVLFSMKHNLDLTVPLSIEPRSGILRVTDDFRLNRVSSYLLEVTASSGVQQAVTNVTIQVFDMPATRTARHESMPFTFTVEEKQSNLHIGNIVYPADSRQRRTEGLHFSLVENRFLSEIFSVGSNGSLLLLKALDHEKTPNISLLVSVEDREANRLIDTIEVMVIVTKANDPFPPNFTKELYFGHVPENSPPGTRVDLEDPIIVTNGAGVPHDEVVFEFEESLSAFRIDNKTGQVFTVGDIDRERQPLYNISIIATTPGNLTARARIIIRIDDVNDNIPEVVEFIPAGNILVVERSPGGSNDDIVVCPSEPCTLSDKSGGIGVPTGRSLGSINKITNGLQKILNDILFTSDTNKRKEDGNDDEEQIVEKTINRMLKNSSILIRVPGKPAPDQMLGHFVAADKDNNSIRFLLDEDNSFFGLHPLNGTLSTREKLNSSSMYTFNVKVVDDGGLESVTNVTVELEHVNEMAPQFPQTLFEFELPEGSYDEVPFEEVSAINFQPGRKGRFLYRIISNETLPFRIAEEDATLIIDGTMDRESRDFYEFQVEASNRDDPSLKGHTKVKIVVKDINDNAPKFLGVKDWMSDSTASRSSARLSSPTKPNAGNLPLFEASVDEKQPPGALVTRLVATDEDREFSNRNVFYRLETHQSLFWIDPTNGTLRTKTPLDFDKANEYNVIVVAADNGVPRLSTTAVVHVNVNQVPCFPVEDVFEQHAFEVNVEENVDIPFLLMNWSIPDGFQLTLENGSSEVFRPDSREAILWLVTSPDRESTSGYDVTLKVEHNIPNSCHKDPERVKVNVKVIDVNDNAPSFDFTEEPVKIAISSEASTGHEIHQFLASDLDEGVNGQIRYSIESHIPGFSTFSVNSTTGQLYVNAPLNNDGGRLFHVTVIATDRDGSRDGLSTPLSLTIHVVDRSHQVTVVFGSRTDELSLITYNISNLISDVSGMEVWVQGVEQHLSGDTAHADMSDVFVYAVNSTGRSLVTSEVLSKALQSRMEEIARRLHVYKPIEIRGAIEKLSSRSRMDAIEVTLVAIGIAILLGTVVAVVCIVLAKRKLESTSSSANPPTMEYHLQRSGTMKTFYTIAACGDPYVPMNRPDSSNDVYVELPESRDKSRNYYYYSGRVPCTSCEIHLKDMERVVSPHQQCHYCGHSVDKARRGHPPIGDHRCHQQQIEPARKIGRNAPKRSLTIHEPRETSNAASGSFQRHNSIPGTIRINYIQSRQSDLNSIISADTFDDSLQHS